MVFHLAFAVTSSPEEPPLTTLCEAAKPQSVREFRVLLINMGVFRNVPML